MSKLASRNTGIEISTSRFACLKIQDTFEDDDKKPNQSQNVKPNAVKPKNKKKKVKQPVDQTAELEAWKLRDDKFAEDQYREELREALVNSKIQFEENKALKEATKSKSNKPIKMSLDEFQNFDSSKKTDNKTEFDVNSETDKYIEEIDSNLEKLVQNDTRLLTNGDKENKVIDKYLNIQYKDEVEKRDVQITTLNETINALKAEMEEIKKRNKQLAFILLQGEMKEKSELSIEIEQLTTIKSELTTQVVDLNMCLEQEKSKVHRLESEVKKSKQKH